MTRGSHATGAPKERLLLCGAILPGQPLESEGPLSELAGLVVAAGAEVVGEGIVQNVSKPNPATLIGRGKAEEIAAEAERVCPDAIVVDNDLSPAQGRNLEKLFDRRVIDRSELILDIFARRAQTRQASLQVELAQNEYLAPRLRRMWTHLERNEGAIGTRGPGETQLETDKRLLRTRIRDLRRELDEIEARKQREVLSRSSQFTVGLVGYTNAGKSTLLNRLTGAQEMVADMLFATLDTRTRQWVLSDGRKVLLSDTVGFLQRLPHHLVASFHATLEEALNADLLLHVVDASHPDAAQHMRAVREVLGTLSARPLAGMVVLNKVDAVADPIALQTLPIEESQKVVFLSAKTGDGLDRLDAALREELDLRSALVRVFLPYSAGRLRSQLLGLGSMLHEEAGDEGLELRMRFTDAALGNAQRLAGEGTTFEVLEPARVAFGPESGDASFSDH